MRRAFKHFRKKARAMPCAVISRAAPQVKQRMTFAAGNFQNVNFFERASAIVIGEEHVLRLLTLASAVFGIEREVIGQDVVPF
ncbi:MAG: hypothetical protein QOG55_1306 [Acidobacteriaceae bacterium]|nr:hypothetical protein [Acidobacteriaceae bacterium]